jgi:hypothetical protein
MAIWVDLTASQGLADIRPGVVSLDDAELTRELNHRSRDCLDGQVACEVFQDAMPAMKVYTLRKRRETLDGIDELTMALIEVWAVHAQQQAEAARRLAVETWLQRNGVITITQNREVLPVFPEQFARN